MLIPSWFQVFLSLTDVADISLFSQLLAWLFSACILTWFMPVRVKGGPEPTKWLPYCAHTDYRGVVSISEVSGSDAFLGAGLWLPESDFAPQSPCLASAIAPPHLDSRYLLTVLTLWSLSLKLCSWILAQDTFLLHCYFSSNPFPCNWLKSQSWSGVLLSLAWAILLPLECQRCELGFRDMASCFS